MIFYFSGTGNSQWIATQLATLTQDTTFDITSTDAIPTITAQTHIGFVFPIYAWAAAQAMQEFASQLPRTQAFTYGVCTCGSDAGLAMRKFPYPLQSAYSIAMPSNYIIGAPLEDRDMIHQKLTHAKSQLQSIAREVLAQQPMYRVAQGGQAWLKTHLVSKGFARFACSTKPFCVTASCNGCGTCARQCPHNTIVMVQGKPTWGTACYQCLRCLHGCAQGAIEYGKHTPTRQRYVLADYLTALS